MEKHLQILSKRDSFTQQDFLTHWQNVTTLSISKAEYADILYISVRKLNQLLQNNFQLEPDKIEKILWLDEIFHIAIETFGSTDKVSRWIRKYNLAIQRIPFELLSSFSGIEVLRKLLVHIDYGIFT